MIISVNLILLAIASIANADNRSDEAASFRKEQRNFIKAREFDPDLLEKAKLFQAKNFSHHTSALFAEASYPRLKHLLCHMIGTDEKLDPKRHNAVLANQFIKQITPEDLKALDSTKCNLIVPMLPYLGDTRQALEGSKCENVFTKALDSPKCSSSFFKFIPNFYLRNHGDEALRALEKRSGEGNLNLLDSHQLSYLLRNPESCSGINGYSLSKLDSSSAILISDRCFANIYENLNAVNLEKNMSKFSPDVLRLASQDDLSRTIFKGATKDQIANFGAGISPQEEKCRYFRIQDVSEHALSAITSSCFVSWLSYNKGVHLGKLYNRLSDGIFESIHEKNVHVLENIAVGDWEEMKPKQFMSLMTKNSACSALPNEANIKGLKDFEPNAECFSQLPFNVQVTVLTSAIRLSESILSMVNSHMVEKWYYRGGKSGTMSGLEILNAIKSKNNLSAIVAGLSSKLESGEHACSIVRSFDALLRNEALKTNLSSSCVESFRFTIGKEETAKLPRLLYLRPFSELKDQLSDEDWNKMKSSTLSGMIKDGGKFCENIDEQTFRLLNMEALSAFDGDCVCLLKFKSKLTKKDIQAMGSSAFRRFNISAIGDVNLEYLTDSQIGELGEDISDISLHPLSSISEATLANWSKERIGKLSIKAWNAIPLASLKGLKEICHIPPAVFGKWTFKQISSLSEPAIITMTKEQAEALGGDLKSDDAENPVKAIKAPLLSKLKPEVQSALTKKGSGGMNTFMASGTLVLLMAFMLPILI